jgi:hypothetical protein
MCRVVRPILLEMLALRSVFALAVMAVVVWLLLSGHLLGALAAVIAAIAVRRAAESGRFARYVHRPARPS